MGSVRSKFERWIDTVYVKDRLIDLHDMALAAEDDEELTDADRVWIGIAIGRRMQEKEMRYDARKRAARLEDIMKVGEFITYAEFKRRCRECC